MRCGGAPVRGADDRAGARWLTARWNSSIREAIVYAGYLIDAHPHPCGGDFTGAPTSTSRSPATWTFDRVLVSLARMHPLLTRVADGYARLFARRAVLRRKLVGGCWPSWRARRPRIGVRAGPGDGRAGSGAPRRCRLGVRGRDGR